MENVQTVTARQGEITTINNNGAFTTTYRADFPGVGWVEFDVLPHAQFRFLCHVGAVDINIQNVAVAAGPREIDNATG